MAFVTRGLTKMLHMLACTIVVTFHSMWNECVHFGMWFFYPHYNTLFMSVSNGSTDTFCCPLLFCRKYARRRIEFFMQVNRQFRKVIGGRVRLPCLHVVYKFRFPSHPHTHCVCIFVCEHWMLMSDFKRVTVRYRKYTYRNSIVAKQ